MSAGWELVAVTAQVYRPLTRILENGRGVGNRGDSRPVVDRFRGDTAIWAVPRDSGSGQSQRVMHLERVPPFRSRAEDVDR
jgi:hypothetical protein